MKKRKMPASEIARRMDLLWGLSPRAPRGPRPALSLKAIVQEAMEIADREGLQAVTMEHVAKRLGVTTMASYRYVRSKSELIDAMVEAALGSPPPTDNALNWRAKMAIWARAHLSIYQRHPWVLYTVIASPPFGPNQLAWFEAALNALSGIRNTPAEKIAIVALIDEHVRGSAQLLLTLATTPEFGDWYARAIKRASTDARYPKIAELVAAGGFADFGGTEWNQFEFGLERVLDGIEGFVKAPRK